MAEIARLSGHSDWIDLEFVEREETSIETMKLGIHLHVAGLSLLDTISILERFNVDRCRSTVHNWVQKAELQPTDGRSPRHVAVDKTIIQLNNERYWLCAAVDPDTKKYLHVRLFRREPKHSPRCFSTNSTRNIRSRTPSFSSMEHPGSMLRSTVMASNSSMKPTGIGTVPNVSSKS